MSENNIVHLIVSFGISSLIDDSKIRSQSSVKASTKIIESLKLLAFTVELNSTLTNKPFATDVSLE